MKNGTFSAFADDYPFKEILGKFPEITRISINAQTNCGQLTGKLRKNLCGPPWLKTLTIPRLPKYQYQIFVSSIYISISSVLYLHPKVSGIY